MPGHPVNVSAKHRLIGVPYREDVKNLFPHGKVITQAGNHIILVPHATDETNLLRNLGFDVPAPIATHYDFEGGTPYAIQVSTAELCSLNKRAYVLNGMGTGKTKSVLWAWRYLRRTNQAKKLLVACPMSTMNFTWAREVFDTLPGVNAVVLHGDKAKRLKRLSDPEAEVFIINHDGLGTIWNEIVARRDIDTFVIDELAVYRNPTAQRTKVARKVASQMQWVWGLTGSPTPNAPTDAWAEASIVTPHTVPKYFGRFRDQVMIKLTQFKWVPKKDSVETVHKALQPAVRFTLDDVVELPELIERPLDVEMGPRQAEVYEQMEREAYALAQNNEITAMNAGAVLNKLLQISTGWVYTRDKTVVPLDNDIRVNTLVDAVLSADNKVLVFVPFEHALRGIEQKLRSEGIDVRAVSGATPQKERDHTFNLFQNTPDVKVLAAHPACMAHGLTLTAADTIIWFAPTTSLEIFEQANARIRRIGQKHKQLVLMLQATKAERQMYARLRSKQKVQNLLLDMFASTTVLPTEVTA